MNKKLYFHEMPENIKTIVKVFMAQSEDAVDSGNWDKMEFYVTKGESDYVIHVPSAEMGFSFDENGKFEGIFNYKE